jgi:curli biogenesis system outer membrane secretion channel CsgG
MRNNEKKRFFSIFIVSILLFSFLTVIGQMATRAVLAQQIAGLNPNQYYANSNSREFHSSHCSLLNTGKNPFGSYQEAKEAGGIPCNQCIKQQPTDHTFNRIVRYEGLKPRISVASTKESYYIGRTGMVRGLRDMLLDALFKTNRFIVLAGRAEKGDILDEIEMTPNRYIIQEKAPNEDWDFADILVRFTLTALEQDASGGDFVIPTPWVSLKFKTNTAYVSMDLRLIDLRTRRIINTTSVEGKASEIGGGFRGVSLPGGLSMYNKTPMGKAVRSMIEKAAYKIALLTPKEYYRGVEG